MDDKNSPYLSKTVRYSPRKLVDAKDMGLLREDGNMVDLHVLLTDNAASVRLVRVKNNIMQASGLTQGGIAIVDRGKQTAPGQIVHIRYNGSELMRRLIKREGLWYLQADDPRVPELLITDDDIVEKLGIVTAGLVLINGQAI